MARTQINNLLLEAYDMLCDNVAKDNMIFIVLSKAPGDCLLQKFYDCNPSHGLEHSETCIPTHKHTMSQVQSIVLQALKGGA